MIVMPLSLLNLKEDIAAFYCCGDILIYYSIHLQTSK